MKPDFLTLVFEHNGHSTFLNPEGMVKAMNVVYQMGKENGNNEVLDWLSKMDYLSDNIQYIQEEWNNQNQK